MPVDGVNSTHFAVGPVVAIVVVAALAMLSKWVFGTGRHRTASRSVVAPGGPGATGLRRPGGARAGPAGAPARGGGGSDAGIRSTIGIRRDGRVQVLVFPDDEERARKLVPPGPVAPG